MALVAVLHRRVLRPSLAHFLAEWMAPAIAVRLAFFIMWAMVGLIFAVSPPSRQWSFARWVGGGALGALIAGALAFVVHR